MLILYSLVDDTWMDVELINITPTEFLSGLEERKLPHVWLEVHSTGTRGGFFATSISERVRLLKLLAQTFTSSIVSSTGTMVVRRGPDQIHHAVPYRDGWPRRWAL